MKIPALNLLFAALLAFASTTSSAQIQISDNVELIKLSENAYIHVSYIKSEQWGRIGANGLLLIDGQQAFLFDSPWNNEQTECLYNWVVDSMHLSITGFIPNHWHEDCMGGLEFLHEKQVKSYANQVTIELAMENNLPVPQIAFTDSLILTMGNTSIECYFLGAAHSMDNVVVWIPDQKILFPACMVKSMRSRNLGNTADGDVYAYPETLRELLKRFPDAKIVIPGHGQYGGMELIEHTLQLCQSGNLQ